MITCGGAVYKPAPQAEVEARFTSPPFIQLHELVNHASTPLSNEIAPLFPVRAGLIPPDLSLRGRKGARFRLTELQPDKPRRDASPALPLSNSSLNQHIPLSNDLHQPPAPSLCNRKLHPRATIELPPLSPPAHLHVASVSGAQHVVHVRRHQPRHGSLLQ